MTNTTLLYVLQTEAFKPPAIFKTDIATILIRIARSLNAKKTHLPNPSSQQKKSILTFSVSVSVRYRIRISKRLRFCHCGSINIRGQLRIRKRRSLHILIGEGSCSS